MIEVKKDKYGFDEGSFKVRNVTDNIIYALFNARNTLKGVYNMSSKTYLKNKNAVLESLGNFERDYRAEGGDVIKPHIVSALVIGGDYCRNKEYNGKIVRIYHRLSDLAVEEFRMATGLTPRKYKFKNPDCLIAIKDIIIVSIDNIIEKIKSIPPINKEMPDFYSKEEYDVYILNSLLKKQQV